MALLVIVHVGSSISLRRPASTTAAFRTSGRRPSPATPHRSRNDVNCRARFFRFVSGGHLTSAIKFGTAEERKRKRGHCPTPATARTGPCHAGHRPGSVGPPAPRG